MLPRLSSILCEYRKDHSPAGCKCDTVLNESEASVVVHEASQFLVASF